MYYKIYKKESEDAPIVFVKDIKTLKEAHEFAVENPKLYEEKNIFVQKFINDLPKGGWLKRYEKGKPFVYLDNFIRFM